MFFASPHLSRTSGLGIKELLNMQQQVNATELKHFQSEMVSSKSQVVADPEFHFAI